MKIVISLMLALLLGSTSFAQDVAHLSYTVSVSSDNPQMASMKSMMEGSKMDIYINGKFTRTDFNLGTLTTTTNIIDQTGKNVLMLINSEMGGQKIALKSTLDEMDSEKNEQGDPKISLSGDTKEIAGYSCKKAIITLSNGMSFNLWYTNKIKIGDLRGTDASFKGIDGVPLEYTIYQGPLKMEFTFTKFEPNAKVADDFFSMAIPDGYKEMTKEDLQKMSH